HIAAPNETVATMGFTAANRAIEMAGIDKDQIGLIVVATTSATSGKQLAELYGYEWRPDTDGIEADLLINATPIGMAGGNDADKL
ncbi:shikimate 5-dehydrogenase, partial [Salmonella enterica subsp. enterica serovar Montevideo]|nr:shikimate 5-dehydrogenase [Salmonella enterica subsp. enterica serovar Montevideo]